LHVRLKGGTISRLFGFQPKTVRNLIMTHQTEYLGYAAGIITTLAFLPQAIRIFRTRQTRDISLLWAFSMNLGIILWLLYGIVKKDLPIITANSITLVLLMIILYFKVRYK
jgi:MtN3 and saliva related transmembrane protein